MSRAMLPLLLLLSAASPARADALRLRTGEVVVGRILERTAREILFREEGRPDSRLPLEAIEQVIPGDTYQTYLERLAKAQGPIDRAALSRWCFERGLTVEGLALRRDVLRESPGNDAVKRALGYQMIAGEWTTPEVALALRAAPYPKDITWSLEWDATQADFDEWRAIVRKSADHLWRATEGQIWLRSVKLVDRVRQGEVWVDPSDKHPGTGAGQVHLARGWYARGQHFTLVHGWGHAFLDLADEYIHDGEKGKPATEAKCVMGSSSFAGFCDATTHTWPGQDCWSRIRKRLPKLRHPNPFPPEAPPVAIEVVDK